MILNYIDPGSGYVLGSNLSAILGLIVGGFLSTLFFFRNRIFPFFAKKWIIVLILLFIGALGIIGSMSFSGSKISKKVVILGFDGMDPNILEKGFEKGRFPSLKKLKESGFYSHLGTTVPPQSPVAWASFITGTTPAKHGIFDFIERDPRSYALNVVFSQEGNKRDAIISTPFWDVTTKNKVPSTVLFLPDTFEPPKTLSGEMISGMGVPDVLGTQGTFTLFTTKIYPTSDFTWRGKIIPITKDVIIATHIEGPKYNSFNETKTANIPLEIKILEKERAEINVQNQKFVLSKGEFSD